MMRRSGSRLVMSFVRSSKADEERGKHGKNKCLQERNEEFKQIDENGKRNRNSNSDYVTFQNETDEDQAENDDMTRRHVCKKTNGKRKRFRKLTDNLNGNHDDPERPVRPCGKVLKIPFDTMSLECGNLGNEEREHGQSQGNVDIPCSCCSVGNKTKQITEENKKENRQQVGKMLFIAMTNV